MATIDYKEKYEQALEVAQRFYNNSVAITKKGLEDIFPELTESECERIRSALLRGFNSMYANQAVPTFAGEPIKDILAWLEKQGMPAKYHDICDTCVRQPTCQSDCFLQQDEQKNDWSEEDVAMLDSAIAFVEHSAFTTIGKGKNNVIAWLKSIKDKAQPQPQPRQEWSEEDEGFLCKCLGALGNPNYCYEDGELECMRNWLKSLRPQSQWKPSDEQMEMVDKIINALSQMQLFGGRNALIDLKHDLEKLRKE